jgi:hypothetical protein
MLQKLGTHIADCLHRAAEADRRAAVESDESLRADNLRMAAAWRHLARSYQFVESLERFLLDADRRRHMHAAVPVLRLVSPDYSFDPEALALLCSVYDRAISRLGGIQSEAVRALVAKQIIEAAARGQRDPDALCQAALREEGGSR